MKTIHTATTLVFFVLLLVLSGCTSKRYAYPGHTPDQVWTVMQAVAESPEYDDWHLTMNEVWVDEEQARIEVYRELRRTLHRPRSRPVNQRRTWRLQFVLEDRDPPTVRFVSRGMGVPAQALDEANRYLVDVRRMLQSEYSTGIPHQPTAIEPDETSDMVAPEIDIDDLE